MTEDAAPRPYWKPKKEWEGETAFILGGGPSLLLEDLSALHNRCVIGVNNAYRLGPWVDFCWFGDIKWWNKHKEELSGFKGRIAQCNQRTDILKVQGVYHFQRGKSSGIDT
jgi:hypothetical protein